MAFVPGRVRQRSMRSTGGFNKVYPDKRIVRNPIQAKHTPAGPAEWSLPVYLADP